MNKISLLFCIILYLPYIICMDLQIFDLYQDNLTKKKIKLFSQENIPLNHKYPYYNEFPIIHWMKKYDNAHSAAMCQYQNNNRICGETKTNLKKALSIVMTFLNQNAIPTKNKTDEMDLNKFNQDFCALYPNLLRYPIMRKDYTKIEQLLRFKPKDSIKIDTFWKLAIKYKHAAIIDLLITKFTKEEIDNALVCTIKITYDPDIMEKLINYTADCNKPLSYLYDILSQCSDNRSINQQKSYELLCRYGAFSQEIIDNFQKKAIFYNKLATCMEPLDSDTLDSESSYG